MKRVLVTGASGFIGTHALPALAERGYEVHALSSGAGPGSTGRPGDGEVRWHAADLLDPAAAEAVVGRIQPSHLLHLAWYAVPGRFWSAAENVEWVEATLRLVRAFSEAGGTRAVLAGSCAEYDWSGGICVEDATPLRPATLYGASKHAAQAVIAAYAPVAGLSAAWGRIFFLYGPREHPARLVSSIARALVAGEPAPCSHGRQVRDFLHVEDVASAFAALVDAPVEGAINVASGRETPISEVISLIGSATGRPELIRWGEVEPPPGEPPLLVGDTRRLAGDLGWSPRYTLEEGIERTVDWWRRAA